MEGLSACTIDTRVVYGFKGAGKTSYISDCIINDFYYKRGTTLILCFEHGKEEYDEEKLKGRNAHLAYYDSIYSIEQFCQDQIVKYDPGRIYVEMSSKMLDAKEHFPQSMNITYSVTWLDWATLDLYMECFKQQISQMVSRSQQITFRNCPSKELLAPYSQEFRLMNHRASYLRQDPLGFHEKAFDLFLPYSLDAQIITITAGNYLIFWLDAADHPQHYENKLICIADPIELRKNNDDGSWTAGRVVMTCCMADLQFMSFEIIASEPESLQEGWVVMEAFGTIGSDTYGRRVLKLNCRTISRKAAPGKGLILQAGI